MVGGGVTLNTGFPLVQKYTIVFHLHIPHAENVGFLKTIYDGNKQMNCIYTLSLNIILVLC